MPEENAPPVEASTKMTVPSENGPVAEIPSSGPADAATGDGSAPTGSPTPDYTPPISSPELTNTVGIPSSAPQGHISMQDMVMHADPVVQGVMLVLLLMSLASWLIIFEKMFVLRNIGRNVSLFKQAAAEDDKKVSETDFSLLTRFIVATGIKESCDSAGKEARYDYRERVERSMRAELSGMMDRVGHRVMFLATVGSVSPFIGLFGTVWGIMHSFIGIAASGETTLSVVAPGIAEALFATGMGLMAAIPAVVAYNKISGSMQKITKEALYGIGLLGNRLARQHFGGLEA
jgi:Biopolymer transport proteins